MIATDFFLRNTILNASFLAWCTAQLLKVIISLIQGKFESSRFTGTGGMPSSHTATVAALCTSTYITCGYATSEFAFAFIFALIVMYDALGIRRAAGEQAKVLNHMISREEPSKNNFEKLKELLGHTPLEVFCGLILGIIFGATIVYI